jgi:transposase-like protein
MPEDNPTCGDVWTFCAIDSDTKLVPSFKVGKHDMATANAFVSDVASQMRNRIQVSTDGLPGYVEAVERAFEMNVDYAQVIKVYDANGAKKRHVSVLHLAPIDSPEAAVRASIVRDYKLGEEA